MYLQIYNKYLCYSSLGIDVSDQLHYNMNKQTNIKRKEEKEEEEEEEEEIKNTWKDR